MDKKRPYFFWDYSISEDEIKAVLNGEDQERKCWVAARILEYALWQDIWKYLTINMIAQLLPHLRMKPKDKELWEYAIRRWRHGSEEHPPEDIRDKIKPEE